VTSEAIVAQPPPGARLPLNQHRHIAVAPHSYVVAAPHAHVDAAVTELKKMAEDAATAHHLPINYFLRLIRQESGFDPNSVSHAGAQGIAQFMPGTASIRGLKDPFDPAEALPKSAELLSELKDDFGNLGLAAAAYNAGPDRIRKWLAGQSSLPQETIDYVRIITGHNVTDWAKSKDLAITLSADAISGTRSHSRVSWEEQLLASLKAAAAAKSASPSATISTVRVVKTSARSSETSLCSQCIIQSVY
jgi:hypothetical protein